MAIVSRLFLYYKENVIKKISCLLLLLFFAGGTTFAQSSPSIEIKEKTSAGLEDFFRKVQSQDYEPAYQMMDNSFIEGTAFEDFKLILSETGLTTFSEKTWTNAEYKMAGVLVLIKGDFSTPDGQVHHLEFDVFNDAHTIKIRNILESISRNGLKKRFPSKEILKNQVEVDLRIITNLLQKRKIKDLYAYLASNPQNRVKKIDIVRISNQLKKSKLNIEVPDDAVIVIKMKPFLTRQGTMRVKGNFTNKEAKIGFVFDYNYQWKWKLGGFSLNAAPLNNN